MTSSQIDCARDAARQQIQRFLVESNFAGFCKTPLSKIADEFVSFERACEQVRELQRFAQVGPESKVLEVGSGFGTFVNFCHSRELFDCRGLEPGDPPYDATLAIAWEFLEASGLDKDLIRRGVGEAMPYADNEFDAAYSVSCLEHTQAPFQVLDEIVRVLKPGGIAVLNFPNYGSWWEGHYNTIMIPHTPKWLFKLQAKMMGRTTEFIDTLQFLTFGKLMSWVGQQNSVRLISTGQEVWAERVDKLDFSEWNALGRVKAITTFLKRAGLQSVLLRTGRILHWETPFIFVFEKK